MKKIILSIAFSLLATTLALAAEKGVHASVELVSGVTQKALFLGVENDTVSLGGSINGKFTVVRIAKDRFKSIKDEQGNDLLASLQDKSVEQNSAVSTIQTDAVADSAEVGADSSMDESAVPGLFAEVENKHVLVALERRTSDSSVAAILENLTNRMLQESGIPVVYLQRDVFGDCRETSCIRDSLLKSGAASAYVGRVTSARAADTVILQMTRFSFMDTAKSGVNMSQIELSAMQTLNDAMSKDKFKNFILRLQGEPLPPAPRTKSYIHVETDPEGANIATGDGVEVCRSPCTFVTADSGKVLLYAYWSVGAQLWGAKSVLMPVPFDTTKISLKLKPVRPELRVSTVPEGADIFAGSEPVTKSTASLGVSPDKFTLVEPGISTVQIKKRGFRDTTVTLFVAPTELTSVEVELQPITDLKERQAQEEWLYNRKKSFIGKTLMGSSIAPILIGALFTYLASIDYDDADKIKQELGRPAAAGGAHYQQRVDDNHELVHKGDRKMVIGGSLIGTGVLLLGVGIVLAF